MGNFFKAVGSGLKAGVDSIGNAPSGDRFTVASKPVTCPHCSSDHFVEGHAQLNTAGMTFLKLDWANRSAATLTCTRCGHIEWFLQEPQETT